MNWARRLKRVFGLEIEACAPCGGQFRIIASIEEPGVIATILAHPKRVAPEQSSAEWPLGPHTRPTLRTESGRGAL